MVIGTALSTERHAASTGTVGYAGNHAPALVALNS